MKIFKEGDQAVCVKSIYPWIRGDVITLGSPRIDIESGMEFFPVPHYSQDTMYIPMFAADLYTYFTHLPNVAKIWRELQGSLL